MGYARYDTALGEARYGVEDTCHEPGCNAKIDRGLAYLCGDTPGSPDEFGCGRWFCDWHLYGGASACPNGQCTRCLATWERDHPDCPGCGAEEGEPCEPSCPEPTGDVLASIEATLADWENRADAMRWNPGLSAA